MIRNSQVYIQTVHVTASLFPANKPSKSTHPFTNQRIPILLPQPRISQHAVDDLLTASLTQSIDKLNCSVTAVACVGASGVCLG
jgi:hypothetical protein